MKLNSGLEAGLHKVVKEKQGYISQMQAHHVLQKRWGYHKLGKLTKGMIDDERDHLKNTLHYMAQRDIVPKMEREEVSVGTDVPTQIANDLANEKHCVEELNDLISAARNAGEDSLRRMVEHCVKDDEVHLAELEKQQNLIKTLGLPNYLREFQKSNRMMPFLHSQQSAGAALATCFSTFFNMGADLDVAIVQRVPMFAVSLI